MPPAPTQLTITGTALTTPLRPVPTFDVSATPNVGEQFAWNGTAYVPSVGNRRGPLRAVAVGDSTVQGGTLDILGVQQTVGQTYAVPAFPAVGNERAGVLSWFTWACLLSLGRLVNVHNAGKASDTTTGTLARFDTEVTALKPDVVFIQGGIRNDQPNGISVTTGRDNIVAMIRKVVVAGALPILVTAYPENNATLAPILRRHNAWLRALAAGRATGYADVRGLPVVDPYSAVVDTTSSTGAWLSGSTSDSGTHASVAGAIAAGQKVVSDLDGLLSGQTGQAGSAAIGFLPTDSVTGAANGPNLHPNPLFLADTNADGIPDSVVGAFTAGTGGSNATVTDAGVIGRSWRQIIGSGGSTQQQIQVTVDGSTVQVGDRLKWSGLVRIDASAGALNAYLNFDFNGAGSSYAVYPIATGGNAGMVMPSWGYFEADAIVPSGATLCRFQTRSISGYGTIQLAQQSIVNMTRGLS